MITANASAKLKNHYLDTKPGVSSNPDACKQLNAAP